MKISKIAKLCRNTKLVCTTITEAGLWIGNSKATYFVPEFMNMDNDGIALAFGLDERQKEKVVFTNVDMNEFNLQDIDPAESLCVPIGFDFWEDGNILRPYKTEAGVLCLAGDYLEPLQDKTEMREIYLRYTKEGKPYFAVKVGMIIYAIIAPAKGGISSEFVNKLGEMYEMCKATIELEEKNAEVEKEIEQIKMENT